MPPQPFDIFVVSCLESMCNVAFARAIELCAPWIRGMAPLGVVSSNAEQLRHRGFGARGQASGGTHPHPSSKCLITASDSCLGDLGVAQRRGRRRLKTLLTEGASTAGVGMRVCPVDFAQTVRVAWPVDR